MQIVILAAGLGTRLQREGGPKALTLLADGRTILEFQLEQLNLYTNLREVAIVVGHQQHKIRTAFPQLRYIENPKYASQNTSKSLLRALETINQEEVLWLNGDVIFHPRILKPIFERRMSCMLVNTAPVGAEEVKYRTNCTGQIIEVSKQVKNPEGEAIGINFFSQTHLPLLKQALKKCADQDYFEKAIETCLRSGCKVVAEVIEKNDCIEIDFLEDLKRADELVQTWSRW